MPACVPAQRQRVTEITHAVSGSEECHRHATAQPAGTHTAPAGHSGHAVKGVATTAGVCGGAGSIIHGLVEQYGLLRRPALVLLAGGTMRESGGAPRLSDEPRLGPPLFKGRVKKRR
jgi:hypothetical protein